MDQDRFQKQIEEAAVIENPSKFSNNYRLNEHDFFDDLFYKRYQFNIRMNFNKRKKI